MGANLLAIVVACAVAATWTARSLVKWRAFVGLSPPAVLEIFTVVETQRGRHGAAHYLRLRHGGEEWVFALSVSRSVYEAAASGETVMLPVQTGRGGVRRMVAPDLPLATADLHHG